MQNFKFHSLSILTAIIFAYSLSILINNIVEASITDIDSSGSHGRKSRLIRPKSPQYSPEQVLQSGFFKISDFSTANDAVPATSNPNDLKLLGTITGPPSIARAMILKKGEPGSEIFKKGSNVYGYKIIAINSSNVKLKLGKENYTLDLFEKKSANEKTSATSKQGSNGHITKKISKSEIQQKVFNNLDNAMKGLRAGPFRQNGKVEGYKLIRVRPHNILYKYGIRSGDILRRINGKKIDSTEKLYTMWQGIKQQNRLSVDIERRGEILTYDINITD